MSGRSRVDPLFNSRFVDSLKASPRSTTSRLGRVLSKVGEEGNTHKVFFHATSALIMIGLVLFFLGECINPMIQWHGGSEKAGGVTETVLEFSALGSVGLALIFYAISVFYYRKKHGATGLGVLLGSSSLGSTNQSHSHVWVTFFLLLALVFHISGHLPRAFAFASGDATKENTGAALAMLILSGLSTVGALGFTGVGIWHNPENYTMNVFMLFFVLSALFLAFAPVSTALIAPSADNTAFNPPETPPSTTPADTYASEGNAQKGLAITSFTTLMIAVAAGATMTGMGVHQNGMGDAHKIWYWFAGLLGMTAYGLYVWDEYNEGFLAAGVKQHDKEQAGFGIGAASTMAASFMVYLGGLWSHMKHKSG